MDATQDSYFYKAFAATIKEEWKGFDAIANNESEIENLSYYRALSCMIKQDLISIKQRRSLLWHYLSRAFEGTRPDASINRFKDTLPVDSIAEFILQEVCNAYRSQVRRTFTELEEMNATLVALYQASNLDKQLNDVCLLGKMCGVLLIRPVLINSKIRINVYTPDKFRVGLDENNQITKVMYPTLNGSDLAYHEWTNEEIRIYNAKGKLLEVFDNYYKTSPFIPVYFDNSQSFYRAGAWSLVENQLLVNQQKYLSILNAVFNANPAKIATNLGDQARYAFSPDRIIAIDGIKQGEGMDMPPTLDIISPDIQYQNILDYANMLEKGIKKQFGLPPSMVDEQAGVITSGISRVIERQGLIERRQQDLTYLNSLELELANKIILILNYDSQKNYPFIDGITVDFEEERVYNEPEVEYNFDKLKTEDGVLHPAQFFKKWSGIDTSLTDDEVIAAMKERKALVKELGIRTDTNNDNSNNQAVDTIDSQQFN